MERFSFSAATAKREAKNLYAPWAGVGAGTETGNDSCGNKGTRECRKYCGSDHNNGIKRRPREKCETRAEDKRKLCIFAPFQHGVHTPESLHSFASSDNHQRVSNCPNVQMSECPMFVVRMPICRCCWPWRLALFNWHVDCFALRFHFMCNFGQVCDEARSKGAEGGGADRRSDCHLPVEVLSHCGDSPNYAQQFVAKLPSEKSGESATETSATCWEANLFYLKLNYIKLRSVSAWKET